MRRVIATAFLALLALQGCSAKKISTNVIGAISTDGMVAIESESDIEFAKEALPPIIKTLEVLSYGNRKDAAILALLAKAYGSYTFGFVEEDILRYPAGDPRHEAAKARAEVFYARGRDYGVSALETNSGMRRTMNAHFSDFKGALGGLGKKYTAALFWTAFNWANWINLNRDDPSAIVAMPKIQAMIDRVIKLDPDFFYGSAHAFKGVLACSRPEILGGNYSVAQQEFSAAMGKAPNYLMNRVLYAQYFARQMGDPALFRKELNDVIASDANTLPEQVLTNELARRRAEILLKMEKKLF